MHDAELVEETLGIVGNHEQVSIDSRDFCKRFGLIHRAWMNNVLRKFQDDFEQLGEVRFENALSQQGSSVEFVLLNEEEANVATTYARNSDIVRAAKVLTTTHP